MTLVSPQVLLPPDQGRYSTHDRPRLRSARNHDHLLLHRHLRYLRLTGNLSLLLGDILARLQHLPMIQSRVLSRLYLPPGISLRIRRPSILDRPLRSIRSRTRPTISRPTTSHPTTSHPTACPPLRKNNRIQGQSNRRKSLHDGNGIAKYSSLSPLWLSSSSSSLYCFLWVSW
jgi:hypothetical protein